MSQDVSGTSGNPQSDQSTGAQAREQGQQVAQDAKQQATSVASTAREEASHVAEEVRSHAQEMVHDAQGQVRQQAQQQTDNVGRALQHLGDQFRALSEGRPDDAGPVRDYASRIADAVEQMGGRLSERGFEGNLEELQRYARRRPGAFLAGAAAAGFFASRLTRGARDASHQSSSSQRPIGTTAAPARPVSESTLPPPPVTSPEQAANPVPPAPDQAAPSVPPYRSSDTETTTTGRMQR